MNRHTLSDLDVTTRHRLLADSQRRALIDWLRSVPSGGETTLGALATALQGPDGATAERLRCRLHHIHLPMLEDAGLVYYEPETKQVRPGESWTVTATADSR